MERIKLEGINKSFGDKTVLKDLSYTFEPLSRTCVTGASGCGKTTLLNIVAGLVKPDSGSVSGVPEDIAMVFQEDRLLKFETAVENVNLVAGKDPNIKAIRALLTELGLEDSLDIPVSELSGGMKRRVALARALFAGSKLLILDEPFTGLDGATKEKTVEVINRMTADKTLIAVTHDISDASALNASVLAM